MRTLLLLLACLTQQAHARVAQKTTDDQTDRIRAIAALLLGVNPSVATDSLRGPHRRSAQPLRKEDARKLRSVHDPWLSMSASRSKGVLRTTGAAAEASDLGRKASQSREADDAAVNNSPMAMSQAEDFRELRGGAASRARKSIGKSESVLVQGGSLKTWSFRSSSVEAVQVVLTTDGRPLDADVQLWEGPDNTPCKMRVYCEDGSTRPFRAVLTTPFSGLNTVAVYNVGQIEFPLAAHVVANEVDQPTSDFRSSSMIVQGGALRTYPFDASVESVEIMLQTDGRPLNARIELLQGPNNNKQVIELYTEDGLERPFFAIIDTMGSGNVVRVVNTAPIEFPMTAMVQPHRVSQGMSPTDPVIGGSKSASGMQAEPVSN